MEIFSVMKSWVQSTFFAFLLLIISVGGVIIIFISTSPANLGATGMLFAFGLFYILFFAIFLLLIHIVQIVFVRHRTQLKGDELKPIRRQLPGGKHYAIAVTLAFAPVILIALRSIGQLDAMSAFLVAMFEIVAIIYILKR